MQTEHTVESIPAETEEEEKVDRQDLLEQLGETVEFSKEYTQKRLAYLKLELAEQTAKVFSGIITAAVILTFGSLALVFSLVVLGLWLGNLLGSFTFGFGIVVLLLLAIMLILFLMRKKILMDPIVDMIISKIFE